MTTMPNSTARMHTPKQTLAAPRAAALGLPLPRSEPASTGTRPAAGVQGADAETEQRGEPDTEQEADEQDLPQGVESGAEDVHGEALQAASLTVGAGVSDGARLPSQSAVTLTGVIGVRRDR